MVLDEAQEINVKGKLYFEINQGFDHSGLFQTDDMILGNLIAEAEFEVCSCRNSDLTCCT